jgi:hypothetical protein
MEYTNGKPYHGTYAGIEVGFTLHGFTPKAVDTFNRELAEAGRRQYEAELSAKKNRPTSN